MPLPELTLPADIYFENKPIHLNNMDSSTDNIPEATEPTETGSSTENSSTVRVKAPEFSETSPLTWFRVLEALFMVHNITSEKSKFFQTLPNLPTTVIDNLPPDELDAANYSTLKTAVTNFFEKSKTELFHELLSKQNYTGKPLTFLREIQRHATKLNIGPELVRMKFINALPTSIQTAVAAQTSLTLEQIGQLANDLVAIVASTPVCNVFTQNQPSTYSDNYSSFHHQGSSKPDLYIGLRPYNEKQRQKVCRAHIFFGNQAKTCMPWCQWPNKRNLKIRPYSRTTSRATSRATSPVPSNPQQSSGN